MFAGFFYPDFMKYSVRLADSGWVYRNPKPYLRAINAIHPCLNRLADGSWLATFDVGQGPESLDYHTVLARSQNGKDWEMQGSLLKAPQVESSTTHSIRTSVLADGRLVGAGGRYHRDDPEEGILNRATMGLCRMDLFWTESLDGGRNWSNPRTIETPLHCEAWEVSHCALDLGPGVLALPLATWKNWKGDLSCGEQSVVLLSNDGGKTWPEFRRSFDGRKSGVIHWEQCVIPFAGGLLAVAWAYDPSKCLSQPSVYSLSPSAEGDFSSARPTGFLAETCEILSLGEHDILAVYRRADQPGLWAEAARIEDGVWIRAAAVPLWRGQASALSGRTDAADALSDLKFGSPSMRRMEDGSVLVLFWCQEDGVTGIRWLQLEIQAS